MESSEIPAEVVASSIAPGLRKNGLALNAFYLLLGQVASTALSIVLSAALGRTLGAADFGVYFLVLSMSTFAYVFVDWGQSALIVREAARQPEAIGRLLGSALLFRTAAGLTAALLTAALARLIGYELRIQGLAGLMVFCALPLALSQPYGYLFRGQERMDLDALVTVVAKVLTVAITVPALLLGGRLGAAVVAQGLGGLGALAVAVVLAGRIRLPRPQADRATVRMLGSEGSSIAIFFVAIAVQPYIDAILLSKLTPPNVMGWFGAARNIIGVLVAPATILAAAAYPQLSRAASSAAELQRVLRRTLRPLLGLGALGAVGCFLFADFVIAMVYSRGKFGPAAGVLQLFAPMLLLFYVDMLLATAATAAGKTRSLAIAKLGSVVVSTALALLLVPMCQTRFGNGGMGVVLAFGASEVLMLGACIAVLPRRTFNRTTLLDLSKAIAAGLGTLVLFRFLPTLTPWLGIPVCCLAFATLALTVGLVSWAELLRLPNSVLRR